MKQFRVLDRDLSLHQHYLLEASAGTGKTFSIQNIVVRLLIEHCGNQDPLSLQKILVVTFTRASTRDLKLRIRTNIEQNLILLKKWETTFKIPDEVPDFLKACMQQGEGAVKAARRRLQNALFTFDQAQIFTIHSFCARMLRHFAIESDVGINMVGGEDPLSQTEVMAMIHDYFRTEVRADQFSPGQLKILLKLDPEKRSLFKFIQTGYEFPSFTTFEETRKKINEHMLHLKKQFSLTSEKMIQDFEAQAGSYKNYKAGESKGATLEKIIRFAHLFDQKEWRVDEIDVMIDDGIVWIKALDPQLKKAKTAVIPFLNYPELTLALKNDLHPLVEEARNGSILLARMARECRKLLNRFQKEEEKFSPDDILRKMSDSLEESSFLNGIQEHYQAAIIDEFQDTDPLQWNIFKKLFLSDKYPWLGYLYLVGDPKQSIYSFRQADIYTYLSAAESLGKENCFSLDVNYRSQPRLIQALNTLFSSDHLPNFIPLPKRASSLVYKPVQAGRDLSSDLLSCEQDRGSIHFFVANGQDGEKSKLITYEEKVFFPFIAREILQLRKQNNLQYNQFAVLVRDRHQALRLTEFLDQIELPYLNQRGTGLAHSPAYQALIDFMQAVLHPNERGALKIALGGPIMGWTYDEIKKMESLEFIVSLAQRLKSCLFDKGFTFFFQELLETPCKPNGMSVMKQILSRLGGKELYRDLQQMADLIVDHQTIEWNDPEGIIPFLDQFQMWEKNDDGRVKRFQDPMTDGVKILTLHFCKGLEFDVVFALGLMNRKELKDELIPVEYQGRQMLIPKNEASQEYIAYCEEADAEKMRQFYVACTRAKLRLYLPAAMNFSAAKIKYGEASPMDLFFAKLDQKDPQSYHEFYERIKSSNHHYLFEFLENIGKKNHMTYSIHESIEKDYSADVLKLKEPLIPPSKVVISEKRLWMTSFSNLSKKFEDRPSHLTTKTNTPHNYACEIKSIHTLPANRETGLLIHSILERMTFKTYVQLENHEERINFIRPFVQNTLFDDWDEVIAQLLWNTLTSPLSEKLGSFCLGDLDSTQIFREMPFIFPFHNGNNIEDMEIKEGMIKGVVDLFFTYDNKYYLLDWKTNWLGNGCEHYEKSYVDLAMQEHAYHLQAEIYKEAVKRYLSSFGKINFEECFGGVFYLFLRGITPGSQNGIHISE